MNKRYEQTDEERDQLRKLQQEEAHKQKSQQQSQDTPHRQQGGWNKEEDRSKRPGHAREAESGGSAGEARIRDEP